jgi:hypothetical protein
MSRIWRHLSLVAFVLVLVLAAYLRFWAAPLSAGVDVPQFWAFAKVFQTYGLDFYRYAGGTLDIFPVKSWGFVYPPVWLLISRVALMAAPASAATATMVDVGWRLAMKTPIIAADLAIGGLLYWAVPGSRTRKLIFASLWLLSPTAWYESAVFGQFDAIAAVLLLAAVILLGRGRDRLAFLLAGLAIMTKQHTAVPAALLLAINARQMGWRRLLSNVGIVAGVVALLSLPFVLSGNFLAYARALFLPGQTPTYQAPLLYSFSGSGALLTYLHNVFGWSTDGLMRLTIPVLALAVLAAVVLSYRRALSPVQGALAGFLILVGLSYQVNYQYLIVCLPLALLAAAGAQHRGERVSALVLALLPAVWLWLFDVSFWFTNLKPASPWVVPILERLGLTHLGLPDVVYVAFALVLAYLSLAYAWGTLRRWYRAPAPSPVSPEISDMICDGEGRYPYASIPGTGKR